MQNPIIPQNKANLAIISGQASDEIMGNLISRGIEVVKTIKEGSLPPGIGYHPDMVIHPIGKNTLLVAPSVFDYYYEKLGHFGLEVIKGDSKVGMNYPEDIKYNVLRIGRHFVHKRGYTDKSIDDYYNKNGISFIDVRQGYVKCSVAIIDQESAITADKKIAQKLSKAGYDILLIESGWISLPGYEYGFVGGASGHISPKDLVFTGSLGNHPDRPKIESFVYNKGIDITYLSKDRIIDLGTVFCFSI